MGAWRGGTVEPPPYPGGVAPFGGEPIDFHRLIRIWHRRMVRRWQFEAPDPHHRHDLYLQALPDGPYCLHATASREQRVWLFADQAAAEEAATRMRAALWWPGTWSEVA